MLKAIGNNKISYVLLLRNHGYNEGMKKMHYYAPFEGQVSTEDFQFSISLKKRCLKNTPQKKSYTRNDFFSNHNQSLAHGFFSLHFVQRMKKRIFVT